MSVEVAPASYNLNDLTLSPQEEGSTSPDEPVTCQPMGMGAGDADVEDSERANINASAQPSYGAPVIAMPPPPSHDEPAKTDTVVE